uniref:VWFA domain-containing protein n=1 Tax=Biomphalaria glabrata TaxID=6526 RepID=A0A2C9M5P4_BIOGL
MFAVGVGRGINDKELLRIAGDYSRINHVDSFDNLKSIVQRLAVQTCVEECQTPSLELGIVLDSSSSIWVEDFKKSIKFLQTFLQQLVIDKDSVRVAIIPYSNEVHTKNSFNLNTYTTKKDVLNAIGKISHEQGNATYTNKGIKYMRERQLSNAVVRPGVTRIGLVITDGESHELEKNKHLVYSAQFRMSDEFFGIAKGQKNQTDIYFVFSPSYLGYEITLWTKELISSIISMDVNKVMKCGLLSDPCPSNVRFKLESYSTAKEITKELNPYLLSYRCQLADSGYTVQRGARPNARKVAVLVVESVKSAELVSNQVKNLQNKGITVFIADPTKSGAEIKGVTTLKGGSEEQATELIQNLLQ